jgi:cytochrome c-type biogenesis protein
MQDITIVGAFVAGLASSLSPCVLPLVPVYLASLSGPEIFETGTKTSRLPVFLHSLSFVVGFSIVFTFLGASIGLLGFAIGQYLPLREITGSLLVAFGLFMLAALKVPWLNYEKRFTPSMSRVTGYLRSLITGGLFSFAWIPCTIAPLGVILTFAGASETAFKGAYLLAVYSLGLGVPFLIVGAAFDYIVPLIKRVYRYSGLVYMVSGVLLIAIGILILTNNLEWLIPS